MKKGSSNHNKEPIGGFFELELSFRGKAYHEDLIKLNTARNALEFILLNRKYVKVYIPYYTCRAVLEPFLKHNISYSFYKIDSNLEIAEPIILKDMEAILYTNYFGIKDNYLKVLSTQFKRLIIDNSQAFFSKPLKGIDTFYSLRKFFGVSDGAYLSTVLPFIPANYEDDVSYNRFFHLIKRIEEGPQQAYEDFRRSEKSLDNQEIMNMSKLTQMFSECVDYDTAKKIRLTNFAYLHEIFNSDNLLNIDIKSSQGFFCYPLLLNNGDELRKIMIKNNIFVAQYWPEVLSRVDAKQVEYNLTQNTLCLPIDQRYTKSHMGRIITLLKNYK